MVLHWKTAVSSNTIEKKRVKLFLVLWYMIFLVVIWIRFDNTVDEAICQSSRVNRCCLSYMGKHMQRDHSGIAFKSNDPGCMWGILQMLDHSHWHNFKKRLPYKRHCGGRHAMGKQTWFTLTVNRLLPTFSRSYFWILLLWLHLQNILVCLCCV